MIVAIKKNPIPSFEVSRRKFTIVGAALGSKIDSISYLLDEAISYTTTTLNNHFASEYNCPIDLRSNGAHSTLPKILPTDNDSQISSKLRTSIAILINRTILINSISNFFTSIYSTPLRVFGLVSSNEEDKAKSICGIDDLSEYACLSVMKLSDFVSDSKIPLDSVSWDLGDLFSNLLEINRLRVKRSEFEIRSDLAS